MSKGKKRCGQKGRNHATTMNAPTMNGMQQVNTWNLMEIIPMIPGAGTGY
jgi:hypothetical protein